MEVVGLGALKLTGFLRELMQRNNISFASLYTVRTLKEVFLTALWMVILFLFSFHERLGGLLLFRLFCMWIICYPKHVCKKF